MMVYGYCRISRKEQNIERQQRNILAAYPEAKLILEAFTGTKMDRPQWEKLTAKVKAGDTLVFDSVSRMSRNATDGWEAYKALYEKGINLVFLKEHHIDSTVYKEALNGGVAMTGTDADLILSGVNAYLLRRAERQIQIAFEQAEKEVEDLHQRTREGIETARRNGKQIGQVEGKKLNVKKQEPSKAEIKRLSRDFDGQNTDKEVIQILGIARNTYYKYKRELKA